MTEFSTPREACSRLKFIISKTCAMVPAAIISGKDQNVTTTISVEISPGELVDKITILEIKLERINDPAKLKNIGLELNILNQARAKAMPPSAELDGFTAGLKEINGELWKIEDHIRERERGRDFGSAFVELARAVYRSNDKRADLKRRINELLGSRLVEEKSYAAY